MDCLICFDIAGGTRLSRPVWLKLWLASALRRHNSKCNPLWSLRSRRKLGANLAPQKTHISPILHSPSNACLETSPLARTCNFKEDLV